jgi:hypothetical protein
MNAFDPIQRKVLHSSNHLAWLLAACVAMLPAACASMDSHSSPGQVLARYQAVAGAPVDSMPFLRLDSWQPLDDEHLVVWTSPREAYLLKVWPNCAWLVPAPSIGLTSTVHRVYVNLDKVLVPRHQECPISEIRPIDVAALKRARAAERAAQSPSGM